MRTFAVVIVAMLTAGCGAQLVVKNTSRQTLENVVVRVTDKNVTAKIGRLAPAASSTTSICPKGEAGVVRIAFDAAGQHHESEEALYFECDWMYRVQVEVLADLGVKFYANLR